MNKTELQKDLIKPKQPENKVLDLIVWIEENKDKVFSAYDIMGGSAKFLTLVLLILAISSFTVNLTISDFAVKTSLQFASIAVLISYVSLIFQISEKGLLERRFGRAIKKKSFNDKEKLLLWALIKIKNDNEEISLKTLYEMDKEANGETFSEKSLIKGLCT
jgi:hypothetical protein